MDIQKNFNTGQKTNEEQQNKEEVCLKPIQVKNTKILRNFPEDFFAQSKLKINQPTRKNLDKILRIKSEGNIGLPSSSVVSSQNRSQDSSFKLTMKSDDKALIQTQQEVVNAYYQQQNRPSSQIDITSQLIAKQAFENTTKLNQRSTIQQQDLFEDLPIQRFNSEKSLSRHLIQKEALVDYKDYLSSFIQPQKMFFERRLVEKEVKTRRSRSFQAISNQNSESPTEDKPPNPIQNKKVTLKPFQKIEFERYRNRSQQRVIRKDQDLDFSKILQKLKDPSQLNNQDQIQDIKKFEDSLTQALLTQQIQPANHSKFSINSSKLEDSSNSNHKFRNIQLNDQLKILHLQKQCYTTRNQDSKSRNQRDELFPLFQSDKILNQKLESDCVKGSFLQKFETQQWRGLTNYQQSCLESQTNEQLVESDLQQQTCNNPTTIFNTNNIKINNKKRKIVLMANINKKQQIKQPFKEPPSLEQITARFNQHYNMEYNQSSQHENQSAKAADSNLMFQTPKSSENGAISTAADLTAYMMRESTEFAQRVQNFHSNLSSLQVSQRPSVRKITESTIQAEGQDYQCESQGHDMIFEEVKEAQAIPNLQIFGLTFGKSLI
ncbi:UNKNOWN [Stylonychia lemnae]|uniref:Uncharacterized protein n=1 Tax=Stylonychia lemnae TaxID=5949 RepID=A0A078AT67_STYLE|nr:UNKNOWN [Stylonychia lemnae]|eukprot:CDW84073.1 UNKNOWN [Stylonychia lemnae]